MSTAEMENARLRTALRRESASKDALLSRLRADGGMPHALAAAHEQLDATRDELHDARRSVLLIEMRIEHITDENKALVADAATATAQLLAEQRSRHAAERSINAYENKIGELGKQVRDLQHRLDNSHDTQTSPRSTVPRPVGRPKKNRSHDPNLAGSHKKATLDSSKKIGRKPGRPKAVRKEPAAMSGAARMPGDSPTTAHKKQLSRTKIQAQSKHPVRGAFETKAERNDGCQSDEPHPKHQQDDHQPSNQHLSASDNDSDDLGYWDWEDMYDFLISDETRSILEGFLKHCRRNNGRYFWVERKDVKSDGIPRVYLAEIYQRIRGTNQKFIWLGDFFDAYCTHMQSWENHPEIAGNAASCLQDEEYLPAYLSKIREHVLEVERMEREAEAEAEAEAAERQAAEEAVVEQHEQQVAAQAEQQASAQAEHQVADQAELHSDTEAHIHAKVVEVERSLPAVSATAASPTAETSNHTRIAKNKLLLGPKEHSVPPEVESTAMATVQLQTASETEKQAAITPKKKAGPEIEPQAAMETERQEGENDAPPEVVPQAAKAAEKQSIAEEKLPSAGGTIAVAEKQDIAGKELMVAAEPKKQAAAEAEIRIGIEAKRHVTAERYKNEVQAATDQHMQQLAAERYTQQIAAERQAVEADEEAELQAVHQAEMQAVAMAKAQEKQQPALREVAMQSMKQQAPRQMPPHQPERLQVDQQTRPEQRRNQQPATKRLKSQPVEDLMAVKPHGQRLGSPKVVANQNREQLEQTAVYQQQVVGQPIKHSAPDHCIPQVAVEPYKPQVSMNPFMQQVLAEPCNPQVAVNSTEFQVATEPQNYNVPGNANKNLVWVDHLKQQAPGKPFKQQLPPLQCPPMSLTSPQMRHMPAVNHRQHEVVSEPLMHHVGEFNGDGRQSQATTAFNGNSEMLGGQPRHEPGMGQGFSAIEREEQNGRKRKLTLSEQKESRGVTQETLIYPPISPNRAKQVGS